MEVTPVAATTALPAAPLEAQPVQPVVERQLFDYLAEVEKSGAGHLSDPAALAKAAVQSLEGTVQQIQDVLGKAKPPAASEGDAASTNQTADASSTKDAATTVEESASQLLERSMSVMWAAANLEVVVGSVTAVTSSTSTLIKQQ
ncbi:hypothetical protein [Mesorhizobium sp. ZC-5]|jgi:hypothetical protein|uniref:hypothetical protein n=1 Tax=Mesorhizobium sp. ZC-5 TaxID=2986066 RepID=UPI0021E87DAB|nr:hypothetical protein [Mesorhizobium sp. ZC-5]MCV3242953.1 hypothetical protein [Mesorhizobium sp. ZC-5]